MCCEQTKQGLRSLECKCCHSRSRRSVYNRTWPFEEPNIREVTDRVFGKRCLLSAFIIANYSHFMLVHSPHALWNDHPFNADWQCRMMPGRFIKTYTPRALQGHARLYQQSRDQLTSQFQPCVKPNIRKDYYCFCCLLDARLYQNLETQSIDHWDELYNKIPLSKDQPLERINYWMNRRMVDPTDSEMGSEKDSLYWDTTSTSPNDIDEQLSYPKEDDYIDEETIEEVLGTATQLPSTSPLNALSPKIADVDFVNLTTTEVYEVIITSTKRQYETTTELLPTDQEQVIEDLEILLQNDTSIPMDSMEHALDSVNLLFEEENTLVTGDLLLKLDQLGPRLDLEGSSTAAVVRDNVAVVVAEATPFHPVRGLRVTTHRHDIFNDGCFDFISGEDYSQYLSSDDSDAVVSLPLSVTESHSRMSFVVFRDDRAFRHTPGKNDSIVNSRILSVNVDNVTSFENGEMISIYLRPTISEFDRHLRRACAYWRFLDDGTGYWSEDGCTLVPSTSTGILDTCQCNHLTHFAEVLIAVNRFSELNELILEILSITGCCFSILGISLVVVTAFVFPSWRNDFSNKIWLQLCLAILILNVCFLLKAFVEFERDIWCMIAGVIMHYSLLVSFFWMLVAAIISYGSLVLVFRRDVTRKLLKSSLFAWGCPLLILVILLVINPNSYGNKFEDTSRTSSFCYPSGLSLWLSVFLPLAIILVINWSLFIAILHSMFKQTKIRRHGNSNEALRSAVVSSLLVFLFGLPWVFGLVAYNIIAAYIFTLLVTLQGFVLFVFFIVANKRTRDLWVKKLRSDRGRSVGPTSLTTESTTGGQAGPSIALKPFGVVQMRESDEIKSLLQRGVSLPGSQYTRPAEKPDEYYE